MATDDEISIDTAFEILSSSRRRQVLNYLSREDGEATLSELAAQVAAMEDEVPREEVSDEHQNRVYISLYQTHIPRLEEHGIVEYDSDSGVVRLVGEEELLSVLQLDEERQRRPWYLYYTGWTLLGWIAVVLVAVELVPATTTVWASLTVVLLLGVAVLVALQYMERRGETGPSLGEFGL